MTNNESVVGRRRVYYDNYDNQTLIASNSEEEDTGDDDDKHKPKHVFTKGKDSLIWYIFLLMLKSVLSPNGQLYFVSILSYRIIHFFLCLLKGLDIEHGHVHYWA